MSGDLSSLVGEYTLTRVNGNAPKTPVPVKLHLEAVPDDKSKLRLHTKVANSMGGTVSVEEGNLKGFLMSTHMMGPPPSMTVEHLLSSGLVEGMAYTLEGKVLTMTAKTGSLEWTAA